MSNTVITNFRDASGPRSSADSPFVVVLERDGTISLDSAALDGLVSGDGSSGGISVVRVGQEGKPEDATDSETEDDGVPHVTLSVDGYYDDPNGIAKYDSGIEMLQSLSNETREHSLIGFQNDHCYTPLTSPSETLPSHSGEISYDEKQIELPLIQKSTIPSSKKITILEQQIIPKGKKLVFNAAKAQTPVILKGNDLLSKPLPGLANKLKKASNASTPEVNQNVKQDEPYNSGSDKTESSASSTSGESINDRDSDSDYKYTRDHLSPSKLRKSKTALKGVKKVIAKNYGNIKNVSKAILKSKPNKSLIRQEIKDKIMHKKTKLIERKSQAPIFNRKSLESPAVTSATPTSKEPPKIELKVEPPKPQKVVKKEKKTPTALISDMTSLFTSPDVMRRVSLDGKVLPKGEKVSASKDDVVSAAQPEISEGKPTSKPTIKTYSKSKDRVNLTEKMVKEMESIPQIDDASLAQLLQDTPSGTETAGGLGASTTTTANPLSSPNLLANTLAGPLSPTLDLLAGLQPEEEGLTEDLLMHVAQLVESSENLQEVIDKQVLGKVESVIPKQTPVQPPQTFSQTAANRLQKPGTTIRKDPIQIVRRDGRIINLPPIEAPATRSSKRKSQPAEPEPIPQEVTPVPVLVPVTPELPSMPVNPKQYPNRKMPVAINEPPPQPSGPVSALLQESVSDDSLNSEDDPYRLWCICKQPHNNRFMICCDRCEDWFHGKCVNITKAMGQQMEEQGAEWTCPNCIKKQTKSMHKPGVARRRPDGPREAPRPTNPSARRAPEVAGAGCIVCEKAARAGSIYCSDACILRHAQDSLATHAPSAARAGAGDATKSRVIVFERKTGRVLQGPNAPTAENLKSWLQEHPTFEVVRRERENKPLVGVKKTPPRPPQKIQTTLKYDKQQKQIILLQPQSRPPQADPKQAKSVPPSPQEDKLKSPISTKPNTPGRPLQLKQTLLAPKDNSGTPKQSQLTQKQVQPSPKSPEYKKTPAKLTPVRTQSSSEKQTNLKSPTTPTPRRREREPEPKPKMTSTEPIRENVRKAMQEHMTLRFSETKGPKFSEEEIKRFAVDTELEMHNLFKEVSMKYKAKYRSLIFNIKDRKNLSLWQKICDRTLTPKQLVHMSPEELASQELAQWRDKEAKYQLELIKKSELDLLAANKTYVLKTHKGEEVMENKKAVATELDPNVSVEDLVTALNDSTGGEEASPQERDSDKANKQARHKDQARKKTPPRERETRARSSSRHKKEKGSKKKGDKDDKERKPEARRSRRDRNRSRSRDRTRDRSKQKAAKKETRSKSTSNKEEKQSPSSSEQHEKSRQRSRSRDRSGHRSRSKRRSQLRSQSRERAHRSLSRENDYHSKDKYSSKETDSIERPKSAMQRDVHPEYDPHEPMITSAFSEEELRRSREASLEQSFGEDVEKDDEYDPADAITLHGDLRLSLPSSSRVDRIPSEAESDQEPSSTVDSSAPPVWSGLVNMVDVARFYVAAHEVSGNCSDLEEELSAELDIVGRINPETVWDYISKMRKTGSKDILVLRLSSSSVATVEERMQYIALYSYLSSRNRLGVVKVSNTSVKDFYIFPLASSSPPPAVLAALAGPGLDDSRNHLLLAIIVRQRKKRHAPTPDLAPAKRTKSGVRTRSYTPPTGGESYTPPTSPARRAPAPSAGGALRLPLPFVPPTPALSTSVKDKIAASLASADEDEPYSPGSSSGSSGGGGAEALRSRVDEINRQIEEQKQQILSMSASIQPPVPPEDEAYSPSRPMTPPPPRPALADISLPSNLQEILATIQQRSAAPPAPAPPAAPPPPPPADVDMRVPPPPPGHLHALSEEELLRMVPDNAV